MTQRTWLITGVSSGFGRELTEQLLDGVSASSAPSAGWTPSPTSSSGTRRRSGQNCST